MYCHQCGMSLPHDSQFCPFCGTQKDTDTQHAAPETNTETLTYASDNHMPYAYPTFMEPETTVLETEPDRNEFPTQEDYMTEGLPVAPQAAPFDETASTQTPYYEYESTPSAPKKKKSKKKVILLVSSILVVLIVAGVLITLSSIQKKKQTRYDEGTTLLERGDYGEALEIFLELKDFSDSPDKATHAQQGLDYDSAVKTMQKGNYNEAKSAFEKLGSFKDSNALAKECQKAMDYESAMTLYEAGNYQEAETMFKSAAGYKDANEFASKCSTQLDYAEAKSLMQAGNYLAAKEILLELDPALIDDKDELIAECDNMLKYLDAKEQFEAGQKYAAYKIFTGLGDFLDSATLASDCVVAMPRTGETYRNKDYKGTRCTLVIKPPTKDGSTTYIKLYAENGTLVSSIFINAGDQAKVKLPPGKYQIKAAYSFDKWFGETDMFGDEGKYQLLKIGQSDDIFQFKSNYIYTLTLRSATTTGGGNIITDNQSRSDF